MVPDYFPRARCSSKAAQITGAGLFSDLPTHLRARAQRDPCRAVWIDRSTGHGAAARVAVAQRSLVRSSLTRTSIVGARAAACTRIRGPSHRSSCATAWSFHRCGGSILPAAISSMRKRKKGLALSWRLALKCSTYRGGVSRESVAPDLCRPSFALLPSVNDPAIRQEALRHVERTHRCRLRGVGRPRVPLSTCRLGSRAIGIRVCTRRVHR